jgi:hypothetical protein
MTSYSDRWPGTVTAVKKVGKGLLITVQSDDAKRIDNNGVSESQEYEYTPNPDGATCLYKQAEADTPWVAMYLNPETGRLKKSGRGGLIIGYREKYYDYSF